MKMLRMIGEELRQIRRSQWEELSLNERLVLRNTGILMAFALLGSYIIMMVFPPNWYTVGAMALAIVVCWLASHFLNKKLIDKDEEEV